MVATSKKRPAETPLASAKSKQIALVNPSILKAGRVLAGARSGKIYRQRGKGFHVKVLAFDTKTVQHKDGSTGARTTARLINGCSHVKPAQMKDLYLEEVANNSEFVNILAREETLESAITTAREKAMHVPKQERSKKRYHDERDPRHYHPTTIGPGSSVNVGFFQKPASEKIDMYNSPAVIGTITKLGARFVPDQTVAPAPGKGDEEGGEADATAAAAAAAAAAQDNDSDEPVKGKIYFDGQNLEPTKALTVKDVVDIGRGESWKTRLINPNDESHAPVFFEFSDHIWGPDDVPEDLRGMTAMTEDGEEVELTPEAIQLHTIVQEAGDKPLVVNLFNKQPEVEDTVMFKPMDNKKPSFASLNIDGIQVQKWPGAASEIHQVPFRLRLMSHTFGLPGAHRDLAGDFLAKNVNKIPKHIRGYFNRGYKDSNYDMADTTADTERADSKTLDFYPVCVDLNNKEVLRDCGRRVSPAFVKAYLSEQTYPMSGYMPPIGSEHDDVKYRMNSSKGVTGVEHITGRLNKDPSPGIDGEACDDTEIEYYVVDNICSRFPPLDKGSKGARRQAKMLQTLTAEDYETLVKEHEIEKTIECEDGQEREISFNLPTLPAGQDYIVDIYAYNPALDAPRVLEDKELNSIVGSINMSLEPKEILVHPPPAHDNMDIDYDNGEDDGEAPPALPAPPVSNDDEGDKEDADTGGEDEDDGW